MDTKTSIYIANLGKYTEGELVGEWITCPFTEKELHRLFVKIGLGRFDENGEYQHGFEIDERVYEEYAIHDYSSDIGGLIIDEYDSLQEFSETLERIEALDEYDYKKYLAIIECFSGSLKDNLDSLDDYILSEDCLNEYDLGYAAVENGYFRDIDESNMVLQYIDYESLGRDIAINSGGGFTDYGFIER